MSDTLNVLIDNNLSMYFSTFSI